MPAEVAAAMTDADQVRGGQLRRSIRPASSPRPTRCGPWPSSAASRDVLLISDEVYRAFCYDHPFATPASWNDDVLVVDGFSKAYGMTGWRLGYAHGPSRLIQEMAKLQQFSFVCAPSMAQYGGVAALDQDLTAQIDAYRRKRDMVVEALERGLRACTVPKVRSTRSPAPLGHRAANSSPRRSRTIS